MKYLVLRTKEFNDWFETLPAKTKTLINSRLDFMGQGYFANCKYFDGLIELRWKNGMRIYSFRRDNEIIIALNGGNKNGQDFDIKKAKKIKDQYLNGSRTF